MVMIIISQGYWKNQLRIRKAKGMTHNMCSIKAICTANSIESSSSYVPSSLQHHQLSNQTNPKLWSHFLFLFSFLTALISCAITLLTTCLLTQYFSIFLCHLLPLPTWFPGLLIYLQSILYTIPRTSSPEWKLNHPPPVFKIL